ncbi:MAG: hypothetical protein V2B18_00080 [Pseudomonadota bacterium]
MTRHAIVESDRNMVPEPRPVGERDAGAPTGDGCDVTILLNGASMVPTLPPRSLLLVEPYAGSAIRPGDVVLLRASDSFPALVHRVESVSNQSLITRGDASDTPDSKVVKYEEVVGRIGYASDASGRMRRVYGGLTGTVISISSKWRRVFKRFISHAVRALLVRSPAVSRLLEAVMPAVEPKVVRIFRDDHPDYLLFVGGEAVGRFVAERNEWVVRYPYQVLVDVNSLPKP